MRHRKTLSIAAFIAALTSAAPGAPPAPPALPIPPAPATQAHAEFTARLESIAEDDLDAAAALAQWAVDHDLLDEADDLYRAVLRRDRRHDLAYHGLRALDDSRGTPRDSETLERTASALPAGFDVYETHHYVVLSDAEPSWVREQGKNLERAHRQFSRFAAAIDLRPLPIRHKLVAVAFDGHRTFRTFADAGGVPALPIAGYYNPRDDHLVFYHVESAANVAAARAELEQVAGEAASIRRASRRARNTGRRDEAEAMREEVERRLAHRDARERELNIFARRWSVSVTMHEAIHQLMHHTGVQSPFAPPPVWLSEGLATAFETGDPRRGFGPTHEYTPRRDAFWNLLDNDQLLPLRDLVTMSSPELFANQTTARIAYDQSYAFVTWLCNRRKIELRRYFERLHETRPLDRAAELDLLTEVFGDIDRLEEAWLRHERSE